MKLNLIAFLCVAALVPKFFCEAPWFVKLPPEGEE